MSDSPTPTSLIKVSFFYDPGADSAVARHALRRYPELSLLRCRDLLRRAASLAFIAPVTFFSGWRATTIVEPDSNRFGILVGVLVAILCELGTFSINKGSWAGYVRQLSKSASKPRSLKTGWRIEFSANDTEVAYSYNDRGQSFKWAYFDEIVDLDDYILLGFANATNGIPISKTGFDSDATARDFQLSLQQRLDASGYARRDRIRALLSRSAIKCGMCGYTLKGIPEPTCPECGCDITTFRLLCWEQLAKPWWRSHAVSSGSSKNPYANA